VENNLEEKKMNSINYEVYCRNKEAQMNGKTESREVFEILSNYENPESTPIMSREGIYGKLVELEK
jgi:hypothetical protein